MCNQRVKQNEKGRENLGDKYRNRKKKTQETKVIPRLKHRVDQHMEDGGAAWFGQEETEGNHQEVTQGPG